MREDNNRTTLWMIVAAAVIAVIFIVLWFMRGSDNDRLTRELRAARQSAEETKARLDGEISRLRSDASATASKVSEIEASLRAEKGRAERAEAEAARYSSSETELYGVRQRLHDAETKLKNEEARGADVAGRLEEALNALAATRDRVAGLEQANRELGNAWDRVAELEQAIAAERERAGDLNRRLQASATVIASAETEAALLARANDELTSLRGRLSDAEKAADAERRQASELGARLARSAAAFEEAERRFEAQKNAADLLVRTETELADALAEIERLRTPGSEVRGDNADSVATINIMLKQQRERADQAHERAAEVSGRLKTLEEELEKARVTIAASGEQSAAVARQLTEQLEAARREVEERKQDAVRTERRFEALLAQARDEQAEKVRLADDTQKSLKGQIDKLKEDLAQANRASEQVAAELREGYEKRLAESREGADAVHIRLAEIEKRETAAARLRDNLQEQLSAAQKALGDQKQAGAAAAEDAAKREAAAARLRDNLQEQLSAAQKALGDQEQAAAAAAEDAAKREAAAARLRDNLQEQLSAAQKALGDQE
ncbi:MAG: hypothetical protein LBT97_13990, partial [Planctomycetota bacterium]|nr:hypothetical protein [Planctomycetota bacterium]